VDADAIVARLDDQGVSDAYERDKAEARSAAGSAAELQEKIAQTDGPVRFTAPSLVFERDGQRLVAGGFQPIEAYDVLIANLDPGLERQPASETPAPLLKRFPDGLTTQEVAALLVKGNDPLTARSRERPARAAREWRSHSHSTRRRRPLATRRNCRPGRPKGIEADVGGRLALNPGASCPIDPGSFGALSPNPFA